jgi:hypothetical protein
LTKFDISNNSLYAAGAKALAEGLRGNPVMTELIFAGNQMGKDSGNWDAEADTSGIIALAGVIPGMGALTTLILKDNKLLVPEAGKVLSDMLVANTVLKELDVSSNNWDDAGGYYKGDGPGFAKELAVGISGNGALSKLIFGGNNDCFGDSYAPATLEVGMTEADLSNKNLGVGGATVVAAWISHKDNGALAKLDISGNDIGAEQEGGLQRICEAGGIELELAKR